MDSRQLEVFAAVAGEKSFTRAASSLHLVQSAVSATVKGLERELGTRLFDRSTRAVRLTAAGSALLPHATEVALALRAARDAVDSVSGGLSGALAIGYMTNVTLFDIPRLLGRFSALYPDVTMHLAPAATGTAGLAEALRSGTLDLAFLAASEAGLPGLRVFPLATSPLILAVPRHHEWAGREEVALAETVGQRFVDFPRGFANRTIVDEEFHARGLARDVRIETADTNDTAALVRNGLGVGFLPDYLVADDPAIHRIRLVDAEFLMRVSVATARTRAPSAAATRLATMAREQADHEQAKHEQADHEQRETTGTHEAPAPGEGASASRTVGTT
ncbi:LysR family transcriptional regulator [Frondihabitans cladoniiphilus]|uniref:LysR substrate-binding domain-containing protein n=1 Tax=Frondihabitans cladoniiphilus TaxID=715785 RepID=A0ABP8W806_9MICO